MATRNWFGRAGAVREVVTYVVTGTVAINDTFTITINTKDITATATAGTTTNAVEVLAAAITGTSYPEFTELEFSNSTNTLTITGPQNGANVTITGATSGSATVTLTTTVTGTGPHHWGNADNWKEGSVPVDTDDVNIDEGPSILFGLDQSSVALTSLTIGPNFPGTSQIGLPRNTQPQNPEAGYPEYREQYLKIGATTATINCQSQRIRINLGTDQTALTVNNTGSPSGDGERALDLLMNNASNVVRINKGNVGIASVAGSTSTLSTLAVAFRDQVNADCDVVIGSGVTLTTLKQTGGAIALNCGLTTLTREGGNMERWGSGAITTIYNRVGPLNDYSTGTITTLDNNGEYNRRGLAALTVTNAKLRAGSVTTDPGGVIVWTNAPQLIECALPSGPTSDQAALAYFDFGRNKKITVADI